MQSPLHAQDHGSRIILPSSSLSPASYSAIDRGVQRAKRLSTSMAAAPPMLSCSSEDLVAVVGQEPPLRHWVIGQDVAAGTAQEDLPIEQPHGLELVALA